MSSSNFNSELEVFTYPLYLYFPFSSCWKSVSNKSKEINGSFLLHNHKRQLRSLRTVRTLPLTIITENSSLFSCLLVPMGKWLQDTTQIQ
jgi:hypothetical protein